MAKQSSVEESDKLIYMVYSESMSEVIGYSDSLDVILSYIEDREMYALDLVIVTVKGDIDVVTEIDNERYGTNRQITTSSSYSGYSIPNAPIFVNDMEMGKIDTVINNFINNTVTPLISLLRVIQSTFRVDDETHRSLSETIGLLDSISYLFYEGEDIGELFYTLDFTSVYTVMTTIPVSEEMPF